MIHQGVDAMVSQLRSMANQANQANQIKPKASSSLNEALGPTTTLTMNQDSAAKKTSFQDLLNSAVGQINQDQQEAYRMQSQFQLGDPGVSLTDVLVTSQRSQLGFQALTQIRNKCLEAYRELMNMPV